MLQLADLIVGRVACRHESRSGWRKDILRLQTRALEVWTECSEVFLVWDAEKKGILP